MSTRSAGKHPRDHGRYTQDIVDRCRRLCELHSMAEVARIVGVSDTFIGSAKRRGWKAAGVKGKRLPPVPHDLLVTCDTMSIVELAVHYGVCRGTVRQWLRGVNRAYRTKRVWTPKPIPPRDDLVAVLASAESIDAVAAHYGVHERTLQKWRESYGLPVHLRPRKKRQPKQARSSFGWADAYFQKPVENSSERDAVTPVKLRISGA